MLNELLMYAFCLYSLFAAKAGASRVIAVDGSAKMVSVATEVRSFLNKKNIRLPFLFNL